MISQGPPPSGGRSAAGAPAGEDALVVACAEPERQGDAVQGEGLAGGVGGVAGLGVEGGEVAVGLVRAVQQEVAELLGDLPCPLEQVGGDALAAGVFGDGQAVDLGDGSLPRRVQPSVPPLGAVKSFQGMP